MREIRAFTRTAGFAALTILVAALVVIMGSLEFIRSRILVRVGLGLETLLSARVFDAWYQRMIPGTIAPVLAERILVKMCVVGITHLQHIGHVYVFGLHNSADSRVVVRCSPRPG